MGDAPIARAPLVPAPPPCSCDREVVESLRDADSQQAWIRWWVSSIFEVDLHVRVCTAWPSRSLRSCGCGALSRRTCPEAETAYLRYAGRGMRVCDTRARKHHIDMIFRSRARRVSDNRSRAWRVGYISSRVRRASNNSSRAQRVGCITLCT